jgi:hypothetical protein
MAYFLAYLLIRFYFTLQIVTSHDIKLLSFFFFLQASGFRLQVASSCCSANKNVMNDIGSNNIKLPSRSILSPLEANIQQRRQYDYDSFCPPRIGR